MLYQPYHFNEVTLLVTHYNRSNSLGHLLSSFKNIHCSFKDIVVSDDGSKPEHLAKIKDLQDEHKFRLISSPQNKGLGNNLNKGQDAVNTPFTLYVQEDFEPAPVFSTHFKDALEIIRQQSDIDIVRFYAYYKYPYLKPYGKGFSEMVIGPFYRNYKKIYYYSDHPHLRRSSFLQKFGRYAEGIKGDKTEYKMCVSFIQKKGKGLFYDDYKALFDQKNPANEPSTMLRSKWAQSPNPVIGFIRDVYRQVKYNYDLMFMR